jgi:hypothetical protein
MALVRPTTPQFAANGSRLPKKNTYRLEFLAPFHGGHQAFVLALLHKLGVIVESGRRGTPPARAGIASLTRP